MLKQLRNYPIALLVSMLLTLPLYAEERGAELSFSGEYWNVEDADQDAFGAGLGTAFPLGESCMYLDFKASWFPDVGARGGGDLAFVPLDLGLSYRHRHEEW